MKGFLKTGLLIVVIGAISVFLGYLSLNFSSFKNVEKKESSSEISNISGEESAKAEVEEKKENATVSLKAVGDNLIHDNFYKQANARANGNGYDFTLPYERIEPYLQNADIAFVNQETPIAEDLFPLAGYPRFNSPKAVGEKLYDLGFNLVSYANNHMFDMGEEGLRAHMDFWNSKDNVLSMGAWKTEEDMNNPILLKKNGITFGFVPMTEHTNGLSLPADSKMRYIKTDEWDLIEKQLSMINEKADFQVASIHWGVENSLVASENQKALAKKLSENGVDLIIGHHSHSLQPMEWIENSNGEKTLVVYSLGNFVSSMLDPQNMLGGILDLTIEKDFESNKTQITKAQLYPIVTQYDGAGRRDVRIYPLSEYSDELANKHGVKINYPHFSMEYLNGIVEKNIPAEFTAFTPTNPC